MPNHREGGHKQESKQLTPREEVLTWVGAAWGASLNEDKGSSGTQNSVQLLQNLSIPGDNEPTRVSYESCLLFMLFMQ